MTIDDCQQSDIIPLIKGNQRHVSKSFEGLLSKRKKNKVEKNQKLYRPR
jgi:hypothetical protein